MSDCEKSNKDDVIELNLTSKKHCTAFCVKCGSDLYYFDKECICKNKKCNWTCGGCSDEK